MDLMKVLFAYDGSSSANEALDDLKRAGLPSNLHLLIVSVAEVWVLEPEGKDAADAEPEDAESEVLTTPSVARGAVISREAEAGLDRARGFAEHAARIVRESFPAWTVDTFIYPDSPAWGVLHAAAKWKPDLIILGSRGRSALGRVLLGSVSQKVLSEAECSVRIARHRDRVGGSPLRLLVGVDNTPDSNAAVDEVAARVWPAGTSVTVFAAIEPLGIFTDPTFAYNAAQMNEIYDGVAGWWEHMEGVIDAAVGKLRNVGLLADRKVSDGMPIPSILDEAEELGADSIFLGARGHRFMERFLLGSVSAAVAARADCSVEVVRRAKGVEEKKGGDSVEEERVDSVEDIADTAGE